MSDWLQIHALADDQLDTAEKAAALERLQNCEKSRAEFEAVGALKTTLREKCESISCDDTWAKCKGRISEIEKTRRVEKVVGRYAWAMSAIFCFAILGAATMNRMRGPQAAASDVVSYSSTFAPLGAPRTQSIDERRKWVEGLFPNQPSPIAQPVQVKIIAGAKGTVNGVEFIRLDMLDAAGPMSLFVTARPKGLQESPNDRQFMSVTVQDANGLTWTDGGADFLLVAPRSQEALQGIADSLRLSH